MSVKQRNQIIYRDDILNLLIDTSSYRDKNIIVYDVNVTGENLIVGELYSKDISIRDGVYYSAKLPVLFGVGEYSDQWRFIFDSGFVFPENFNVMTKTDRDNYWNSDLSSTDKGVITSSFRVFPDVYQRVSYTVLSNLTFSMSPHYFYKGSKVYASIKVGLGKPMSHDNMRYQYEMIKRGSMTYNIYRVSDNGCESRWVCSGTCVPLDEISYGFIVDTTGESLLNIPGTYFAKISLTTSDGQTTESPRISFNIFNDRQSGTLIKNCCD